MLGSGESDQLVANVAPGETSYEYVQAVPGAEDTQRYVFVRAVSQRDVVDDEAVPSKLRLVAFDGAGDLIHPTPNVPTGLTLTAASGGTITVRWRYATLGQAAPVASYNVYVATGADSMPGVPTTTVSAAGRELTTTLAGPYSTGTTVRVQVSAVAASGTQSALTAEASVVADATIPDAAANVTVEVIRA